MLKLLRDLSDKGVTYCISVPDVGGQMTYVASPEDVVAFADDPTEIYARAHGVTKQQYLDWCADGHMAICSGTTTSGRRCKNIVKGGTLVSAKRWVALQGDYCVVHGGGDVEVS